VAASVVIAIVAATVALWFTVTLRGGVAITIGALIMGVAVNGMHFTGMYALRVSAFTPKPISGIMPGILLGPIVVFVIAVIIMLLVALLSRSPGEDNNEETIRIVTQRTAMVPESEGGPQSRTLRTSAAAFTRRR
jgi:hypothetical protein